MGKHSLTEQGEQLLECPVEDRAVQEHGGKTLPHQEAPAVLSLVLCPSIPPWFTTVGQNLLISWFWWWDADVILGRGRHRRQRSFLLDIFQR